ncbi:hypothetical protein EJ110_NYTH45376, partial [Nymphaea thermarum]
DGYNINCLCLPSIGRLRSGGPYHGGVQGARVAIVRSPTYQQPVPYGYQQGYAYPSYGYAYGPEYLYAQNIYPYMGHPYLPLYGAPGTFNAPVYPVSQLSHQLPGGHSYAAVQGYAVPGHQVIQLSGPNVNGVTTSPVPAIPAPFPAGIASPLPAGQPHFLVPAHSPQFTQGTSGSDQTANCSRTKNSSTATRVAGYKSSLASYQLCILEVISPVFLNHALQHLSYYDDVFFRSSIVVRVTRG